MARLLPRRGQVEFKLREDDGPAGRFLAGQGGFGEQTRALKGSCMISEGVSTIRGLIIPVDWDNRGNVISTIVSTHFEEEYLIDQNPRADELLAYVRQRVKVRGYVRQDENGRKIITVEGYEVLED